MGEDSASPGKSAAPAEKSSTVTRQHRRIVDRPKHESFAFSPVCLLAQQPGAKLHLAVQWQWRWESKHDHESTPRVTLKRPVSLHPLKNADHAVARIITLARLGLESPRDNSTLHVYFSSSLRRPRYRQQIKDKPGNRF